MMRRAASLLALFAILVLSPSALRSQATATRDSTAAPIDSATKALSRQLVARVGAVDQVYFGMDRSVPAQRAANPSVPPVFWDRFVAEAHARRGELEDLLADVYARVFSADDIRQLLAFYDTPIGNKLLKAQPELLRQSMLAGQEWGMRVGMEVGKKLTAEGVLVGP